MTTVDTRVYQDTYRDSILLLQATTAMQNSAGVAWATAVTGDNAGTLTSEGVASQDLAEATANDLVLAVRAETSEAANDALAAGADTLFREQEGTAEDSTTKPSRTVEQALQTHPSANVAIVSVPGDYAALEAHKALTAGLHVLLFSDNVPIEEEVELKQRAASLGLLVMGAGAGTALLGGVGLGFANAVGPGRVGVVAAAGTGAQEVMVLLDRWGVGVSHVIGVGGRDLSRAVGGTMTQLAIRALEADPATDVILLVSKPPDPSVAHTVLAESQQTPIVATLIGLDEQADQPAQIDTTSTLEQGALQAATLLQASRPQLTEGLARQAETAAKELSSARTTIHGYFSGGTLCSEAQVIIAHYLGPVHSNAPIRGGRGMPAPSGAHVCLDLGEEEYTKGRPHPMIDLSTRIDVLRQQAQQPDVAVLLIDVVLGYGAHADPASELAAVCTELTADGGPRIVAYILGSQHDPQHTLTQRKTLQDAGCLVAATAARAAHLAAAIAARNPDLAEASL